MVDVILGGMIAWKFVSIFLIFGMVSHAVAGAAALQWQVMQLKFQAREPHSHPLIDVQLTAEFLGPNNSRYRISGFYDGGDNWIVRFTPPSPGEWSYCTTCNQQDDLGLHKIAGQFSVQSPPADETNALFRHGGFLKVSGDHHYLTYTDGTPFFWLGDTWWFVPSDLVPIDQSNRPGIPSMYRKLLETRKEQRFTVVHMAFLSNAKNNSSKYMEIADGRVDEAYWNGVDRYIDEANAAGLMPVIGLGFAVKGKDQPTTQQFERVWSYVLARYGASAVTFFICGEYNVATGKDRGYTKEDLAWIDSTLAVGQSIKAHDPYQRAMTAHPWYYSYDGGQARRQSWCDIVMVQGGHSADFHDGPDQAWYRQIYNLPHPKPLIEGERMYEGINDAKADLVRRCAYRAIQSGCCGYTYGAQGLWYPTQDENDKTYSEWGAPVPWWKAIEQPGGQQMKYLRDCYEMLDWWKLKPVDTDQVLDLGKDSPADAPLVKADVTGGQFFIYLPSGGNGGVIQIKVLKAGANYKQILFDPCMGLRRKKRSSADAAGRMSLPVLAKDDDAVVLVRREE